jgi:hypothetical protein
MTNTTTLAGNGIIRRRRPAIAIRPTTTTAPRSFTRSNPIVPAKSKMRADINAAKTEVNRLYRACVDAGVEYNPFAPDGPQACETHELYLAYVAAVGVLREAKAAFRSARFEFRPGLRSRYDMFDWCVDADEFYGGAF